MALILALILVGFLAGRFWFQSLVSGSFRLQGSFGFRSLHLRLQSFQTRRFDLSQAALQGMFRFKLLLSSFVQRVLYHSRRWRFVVVMLGASLERIIKMSL